MAELVEQEPDAGLGNGGLGRLAACFIDSLATLEIPAVGYGLRYDYGIFRQDLQNGYQVEEPDHWLARPDPWEVARPNEQVQVPMGCSFDVQAGQIIVRRGNPTHMLGVPYDRPVVGYGGHTVNYLRLYSARALQEVDLSIFNIGDYINAVQQQVLSETISKVLYPSDSAAAGRELRLMQEYFLSACAVRDIVVRLGGDLSVSSSPGSGTTFTMRLPLTTAISNALLFKVGGHVFAIGGRAGLRLKCGQCRPELFARLETQRRIRRQRLHDDGVQFRGHTSRLLRRSRHLGLAHPFQQIVFPHAGQAGRSGE